MTGPVPVATPAAATAVATPAMATEARFDGDRVHVAKGGRSASAPR